MGSEVPKTRPFASVVELGANGPYFQWPMGIKKREQRRLMELAHIACPEGPSRGHRIVQWLAQNAWQATFDSEAMFEIERSLGLTGDQCG